MRRAVDGLPSALFRGLLMGAAILLCTVLLIRGSGTLLGALAGEEIGAVFFQLRRAELNLPCTAAVLPSAGYFWLCRRFRGGAGRTVLTVIGGVLLAAVLLAVCVLMTEVNTIRFGDVLRSLIGQVRNGILEEL